MTPASAHPALTVLRWAADLDRWSHAVRYDVGEPFTRLVDGSDQQELWLMSWLPGQRTDVHDHGMSAGAFAVVSGMLSERVRRHPGRVAIHHVVPGLCRVFGPGYRHQLINGGPYPAVGIMCMTRDAPRLAVAA